MKVDIHEPNEAIVFLSPAIPGVSRENLNDKGYADYLWPTVDGEVHAERKQWSEILSGMDAVEDQLRRQKQAHPDVHLMLIVEGIAVTGYTGTIVYKRSSKENILVGKGVYPRSLKMVYAWLYQVSKFMEVYFTADFPETCTALTAFYHNGQKKEHRTFQRTFKEIEHHPNPQVKKMMSLIEGLGPVKATALINKFGTVYNVLTAKPEQLTVVEGIGMTVARKLLREVGRADV